MSVKRSFLWLNVGYQQEVWLQSRKFHGKMKCRTEKNRKTLYHNVFSHYFWKCQTKYNISLRILFFEKD